MSATESYADIDAFTILGAHGFTVHSTSVSRGERSVHFSDKSEKRLTIRARNDAGLTREAILFMQEHGDLLSPADCLRFRIKRLKKYHEASRERDSAQVRGLELEAAINRIRMLYQNIPATTMLVWAFHDAPMELRRLSHHGGDEDWLMVEPPECHGDPMWAESGTSFGCCDVSTTDASVDGVGYIVHIGAHS